MTHPFDLLERIERAARRGRGVRLDAGETVLLRRILDLSDAATQAHFLAPDVERAEEACGGRGSGRSPARVSPARVSPARRRRLSLRP